VANAKEYLMLRVVRVQLDGAIQAGDLVLIHRSGKVSLGDVAAYDVDGFLQCQRKTITDYRGPAGGRLLGKVLGLQRKYL